MLKLLSLFFILLISLPALASNGKLEFNYGFFSLTAKTATASESISNPSAFRLGYLKPVHKNFELSFSYTMLLADFSGSDLGYGLDVGANYFPFTPAMEEVFQDDHIGVRRFNLWLPYVGASFNQRNFQSVKNSYAGFGIGTGVERYLDEKMNLKAEVRYIGLSGSNESTATETTFLVGVIFKL